MNNIIENQVVQMEFDNERFERNVHVSINSVKELQDTINMGNQTSNTLIDRLSAVDLSPLAKKIDALSDRFSTFGIVGMTIIQRITNAVIDLGIALESKVVGTLNAGWNQIITGGTSRAANIEQATFQLKGLFGEEVEGQIKLQMAMTGTADQIKELTGLTEDMIVADNAANYAVADTAYGLDSAAKAASQLAASGVDVIAYHEDLADSAGHMRTEMQVALRAISGTAAMTNSSYDEMAHIFATVAGNGRLMSDQLNSLGSRGLNAAATLANYFRETGLDANATEKSIREMVSKSQIDFMTFAKAMDEAYGEHAKDANSTFNGAFDNMRFALSKIGADFIAPLRDDMIPVLNNVRMAINAVRASLGPFLGAFKNASHYITDKLVEKFSTLIGSGATDAEWKGTDQWSNAITNITEVVSTATDILKSFLNFVGSIVQPISEAWKEMFPSKGYEGFMNILSKIKEFISGLALSADAMDKVKRSAKGIFSVINIAKQIITPIIGGIKELLIYFGILDADILSFTSNVGDALYELSESGVIGQKVQELVDKLINFIKSINEAMDTTESLDISGFSFSLDSIVGAIKLFFSQLSESLSLSNGAQKVLDTLTAVINAFTDILKAISGNFITNPEQAGGNLLTVSEIVLIAFGVVKTFKEFSNIKGIDAEAFKQLVIAVLAISASLMMLASINPDGLRLAMISLVTVFAVLALSCRIISAGFSSFATNLVNISKQARGFKGMIGASFAARITTVFDAFGAFLKELGASLLVGSIGLSIWLVVKGITNIVTAFNELLSQLKSFGLAAGVITVSLSTVLVLLMIIMKMYDNIVKQMQKVDAKDAIKTATGITAMAMLVSTCAEIIKDVSQIDNPDAFLMGILGLASVLGTIFALYKIIESSKLDNIDKQAIMLLGLSISLAIIIKSLSSLSEVISNSTNGMDSILLSAGVLISVIVAVGILIMALNAFPASDSTIKALLAITAVLGTIALVGYTIHELAKIGWDQLKPVILSIGAIIAAVLALALIAAHVPIVDVALFAMAAAIASIGVAAAGIGAGLYLGAKAIEILSNSIINLGRAWKENGPEIVEAMHATLTEMAQMLPYFISQMVRGFVDGIKDNFNEMMTIAPYIAQMIGTILVNVFNILAQNIGPINNAFVDFIVNLINSLAERLPDINGAILNLMGALFNGVITAFEAFMNRAAESAGQIFGSLISGIVNGITKSLDEASLTDFAQQLANFMLTLKPFVDGLKGLDESTMNAAKSLAAVITIITANEIVRGLTSWLNTGNTLQKFGEELAEFGPYIKEYSDSVAGLDSAAVESSIYAAQMIADFARTIPNEGGLLAKILGENDIATFGERLSEFGPYIKAYSEDVAGLDVNAVEASTYAAQMLADFARTIPNEGGLLAKITGDNDIETFGEHLKNFGKYISKYAEEVDGLDSKAVESSVAAAQMLSDFAREIPNTGGLKALFEGDNAIDKFGEQLSVFGKYILSYYDSIDGMNTDILLNTTEALLGLFKVLGMSEKVSTGSVNSMKDILTAVANLGLKAFMDAIAVDSADDVEDAIDEFFDNVTDIFSDNSRTFSVYAKLKGVQIALSYGEGIKNEEAVEYVKKAADELGQASVKALEDSIDDPPDGAGETEPAGESFVLGYGNGMINQEEGLYSLVTRLGQNSTDPLDLSDYTYVLGYNNMDQYRQGMEDAESNLPDELKNGSVFSMILNTKPNTTNPAVRSQHEGYFSPNYVPDPEPINAMSDAYRGFGNTLFEYQRATEDAEEETVDYAETYKELETAALNASSSINGVSSSSKKAGKSASSTKSDFEKLKDEIKNVMNKYRDLWKDAKEQANKDLFKGVKDQGNDFLDDIKTIMSRYKNIYKEAVDQTNGEDLFAKVEDSKESFAPDTLIKNLQAQVDQVNELNTIIGSLSSRIADEGLREAISKMSVDDLPQLRALYRMNDSQLSEYESIYQKKVQANQNKIQNELTGSLSRYMGEYTDISTFVAGDAISSQLVTNLQAQIDKFNEYNNTMASLMDRIKDVKLREAISQMGVESIEELKALNSMTDSELDSYISLYNAKIAAGAQTIKTELSANLSELLGEVTDIDQFYIAYANGLTEFSEGISGSDEVKTAAQNAGKEINGNIAEGISDQSSAEAAGRKIVASTATGLSDEDELTKLTEKAQLIVDTIFGVLEDSYNKFQKTGYEIIHMVCRGIDSARKQAAVMETTYAFINTIQRTFESRQKSFLIIGQQIVKGIIEGMKSDSVTKALESAAKSVAITALNTTNKTLGIFSPSREFIKVGKFIDEGLAVGLNKYSNVVDEAAGDMALGTLDPVQQAINQLSGMLDGSIDVNPTITPTLDLSQINAKSAALSNMFNDRQIAIQARNDAQRAEMIDQLSNIVAEQNAQPRSITFNQTNNSPKPLSKTEIYRQTRNGFTQLANAIS